jgi:hypothetical protein
MDVPELYGYSQNHNCSGLIRRIPFYLFLTPGRHGIFPATIPPMIEASNGSGSNEQHMR